MLISKHFLAYLGLTGLAAAHAHILRSVQVDDHSVQSSDTVPEATLNHHLDDKTPILPRDIANKDKCNEDEGKIAWIPTYKRKAVNAHNGTKTKHHFAGLDYEPPVKNTSSTQHKHKVHHHIGKSHPDKVAGHGHHSSHHNKHKDIHVSHRKHAANGEYTGGKNDTHSDHHASKNCSTSKHKDDDESTSHPNQATRRGGGVYKLVKNYSGSSFFDDFHFFDNADPSGGMIDYVGRDEARSAGLIGTKNGNAYMKIGYGNNGVQKAVRISTQDTFTTGIIVLDAYHMPVGCG
jgi:hypothetical protein